MSKKYQAVVFITNAQPLSNAHIEIIKRSIEVSNQIIIVVGSINQPRTFENPFTYEERKYMLMNAIPYELKNSVKYIVAGVEDSLYNRQAWAIRVQEIVNSSVINDTNNIALISCEDSKLFPQWAELNFGRINEDITSQGIRDIFFNDDYDASQLKNIIPQITYDVLNDFAQFFVVERQNIIAERKFIEDYKKQYKVLKWPVTFVTVDAIVVQSGHVLLIERKAIPGKGLWAIPGGFFDVEKDECIEDGIIRELDEETGIKVPKPVLRGCIKLQKVFAAKNRSARGRTITHAGLIVLPDGPLPKVKGSDDAKQAKWFEIGTIRRDQMFEDHDEIIKNLLGLD
jgi:bifunctional NMN adenylyltransferase/nudix hydrolase